MWVFLYLKLCSVVPVMAMIAIDDKLDSPFSTDCFKRISIGERLIVYDVTRTVERRRVQDCEKDCNLNQCTFFSFGISAAGNGTCEISTRREIARRRDADYDIYQRTKHCMEGRPTGYEESCYRRLHIGQRLHDRYIRHSLPCDTLEACQHQCSIEQQFQCHGFNIRLDEGGLGRGVCELTSVPTSFLQRDRDFYREPDFDYYEKDVRNTSPNCGYTNEIVSVLPKVPDQGNNPPNYMPWDQRQNQPGTWINPNQGHHPNEIPNYGDSKSRDWSHGRSIPMNPPGNRLPGYIIIDAGKSLPPENNLRPMSKQNPYGPPVGNNYPGPFQPGPMDNFHGQQNHRPSWQSGQRQVCFQRDYPAMRLRNEMVRSMYTFSRVSDCESMCSRASFQCMGFMYRYARLPDTTPNCYLTDMRLPESYSDLVPDRNCDVYFRTPSCMPVFTLPDTDCFSRVSSDTELTHEVLGLRVSASSVSECELECLRADSFICRSFSYRTGGAAENCQLSDWPVRALTPGQLKQLQGSAIYERGSFGRGCEFDMRVPQRHPYPGPSQNPYPNGPNIPGPNQNPYPNGPSIPGPNQQPYPNVPSIPGPQQPNGGWGRDAWSYFTVRGWPCRRGTQCSLNRDAGFWSCEVEGGDLAQWDYCCRPQHACGYSQGYSYPWCYVGEAGPDQWRPCSENFYPNYNNNNNQRPTLPPYNLGHHEYHDLHHDYHSHDHHDPWSGEYGPPSQWPISYIYPEPPPNETIYFTPNTNYQENPPSYYQNSPQIQFRPSQPGTFPKAIVQKLDIKDTSSSDVPKDTPEIININPRNNYAKRIKGEDENKKFSFSTTGSIPFNVSNQVQGGTFADFMTALPYINDTVTADKINKTKAILDQIEKIIEETKNECNKTKDMAAESSVGLTFSSGFSNGSSSIIIKSGESAMARFWNWGQDNYFSKDAKLP